MSTIREALDHEASARFAARLGVQHVAVAVILAAGAWAHVPKPEDAIQRPGNCGAYDFGNYLSEVERILEPKPATKRRRKGEE